MQQALQLAQETVYTARTEPFREIIVHVNKQAFNFKSGENKFDVNRFAKSVG